MSPVSTPTESNRPPRRRDWLLLSLALLMSFGCVFCATWLALRQWVDALSPANMLAQRQANYHGGPLDQVEFDLMDPLAAIQAPTDMAHLRLTPSELEDDSPIFAGMLPATPTPTVRLEPPATLPLPPPPISSPTPLPGTVAPVPTLPPTSTASPGASPTPIVNTGTPSPTPTPTPGNSSTLPTIAPTDPLATLPPAPTNTSVPANTPKPATDTPVPASTSTNIPTPTATPIPTGTPTPTNTPTDVPAPPITDTPTFTPTPILQISGQVFEDTNYAGGNGSAFGGGDVGLANVLVELYDSSNVLQGSITTNATGLYTFTLASPGNFTIRVVSASLGDADTPPASGFNGGFSGALAEQTYEYGNGGAGALGGNNPTAADTATASGAGIGDTNVTVNVSTASVSGVDFGFAYNAVVNTGDTGQGALRQALLNANAIAGANTIGFAIFGAAPYTIQPNSALPALTDPITIDGWSQPGWAGAPLIELNGNSAGGGSSGLVVSTDNCIIRGLVINRFGQDGLILNNNNAVIAGNYIGTDTSGTGASGNGRFGVYINGSDNNMVGGTAANASNVIAYNAKGVVLPLLPRGADNTIQRNSIYGNTSLGIDLGDNGVTVNDGLNLGLLPNDGMDYPVFTGATLAGSTLTVSGYVGLLPLSLISNAEVEIYVADNDAGGFGEGRTYLGSLTTNIIGNFSGSLTVSGVNSGDRLTGAATDTNGNTSEFGPQITIP